MPTATAATSLPSDETATLAGFILDAETGEGLPGANVFLMATTMGAATNTDGYFVLP
ncbi:carboxypeptidase-like regulatory domain-containing protein [Candidatus Neomarinimicrobiota bacterium]